jgi:hypothetical protein
MLERKWVCSLVVIASLSATSCGDDSNGDDDEGDAGGAPSCGPDPLNTMGNATTGTIKGVIKAAQADKAKASGNLYIAVIKASDFDPTTACSKGGTPTSAVANQVIRCIDLGQQDFAYTIEGVPPSDEDYLVLPFLDVNKNVDANDPSTAGPDACDMISVGTSVKVTEAGATIDAEVIELTDGGSLLEALGCAACSP